MAIPLKKSSVIDGEIGVVIIPRILSQDELRSCNWYDKDDPSMLDCGRINIINSGNFRWIDLHPYIEKYNNIKTLLLETIPPLQIVTRIEYIAYHKEV